jgi:hypothetical protein
MKPTIANKQPKPDFVIRLVGPGIRPWEVPFRKLARTLQAVQRLLDPTDEPDDEIVTAEMGEDTECPEAASLTLIGIRNTSAAYRVASSDRDYALRILSDTGKSIAHPTTHDWPSNTLSAISDLSEIARSCGCSIEFREMDQKRPFGAVLAKIGPDTYNEIEGSAFVTGLTSVMGVVERVGGAGDMRCGIRLQEQPRRMVFCNVASTELVRRLGACIYRDVVVSGEATWIRRSWRLKSMNITGFEEPKDGSVIAALKKIRDAGGNAWDEVTDPEARIAEMRGR